MFKRSSRKRLDTKTTGSFTELLTRQTDATTASAARGSTGCVTPTAENAPQMAFFSAANFLAHDPATDAHVMQADDKHLFAASVTSKTSSRGGHYLRQHIHMELLAQIKQHGGDVAKAIQAAVAHLNKTFRNLHPFNLDILEGVQVSLAYLDFASQKLYVASNGGCRVVVGRCTSQGVEIAAEVGRRDSSRKDGLQQEDIFEVKLSQAVDTIIVGSSGLWQELASAKSVMRTHHFYEAAPKACGGSAAAHLINYALDCVTQRLRGAQDPRMRSLRSVNNLLSLHTGERSQFKWGDRQPVRRRRGDVHGDLTAVIFRLDWEGKQCSFKEHTKKIRQTLTEHVQQPQRQYSHWDLVRLHFRHFRQQSRQHTLQQWQELVQQALAQKPRILEAPASAQPDTVLMSVLDKEQGTKKVSVEVRAGAENQPSTPLKNHA